MASMNEMAANVHEVGEKNIKYIFDLLQSGEEYIKLSPDGDVVLVLGNTGAGKSTLTEFLTGNNEDLLAVEVSEGSGDFIITDSNSKISADSTIISKTTFPDLYIHEHTGANYYDCPGFSDTRSAAHDISTTYFIKKVIDSARAVKLVFVINYSSVRKGVDRKDFVLLLKHATTLLKAIDKYRNSIALVITKVDNQFVRKDGQLFMVPDEKVVKSVADFLRVVKKDLQTPTNIPTNSLSGSEEFSSKALLLIDAFLENTNGSYKKIGIFRRPDGPGLLSSSALLQGGKENLENLIDNNISYIEKSAADFGYTISPESINYVQNLGDVINESITRELSEIGDHIQKLSARDEGNSNDISSLSYGFLMGVEILSKYEGGLVDDPKQFIKTILADFKLLNKSVPIDDLRSILHFNDYLTFLELVSGKHLKKTAEWSRGLAKISKYFNGSKKWYDFLNNLEEWLSEYQLQKHKLDLDVTNLIQQCSVGQEKKTFETDIKKLLQQVKVHKPDLNADTAYTEIKDLTLSPEKLTILKRVLSSTLRYETKVQCTEPSRMIVRGQFVNIRNVRQSQCRGKVQFIEILALKKVFFDEDIYKIGEEVQMSIIAPIWEIIGDRKILLDGEAGKPLRKASGGYGFSGRGEDGRPGVPGGPGGNFLGVTGRVIGSSLVISSVGGRGGAGKEGGDGTKGMAGRDPSTARSHVTRTVFNSFGPEEDWEDENDITWSYTDSDEFLVGADYYYRATGSEATKGGDGGHGGAGGLGGRGGTVKMVDLSNSGKVSVISRNGNVGEAGKGGLGGAGAPHGVTLSVSCRVTRMLIITIVAFTDCTTDSPISNGLSGSGSSGRNGLITNGRISPRDARKLEKPQHTINEFKMIVRESLLDTAKGSYLIEFIDKLSNNKLIQKLLSTIGLADDLERLENQFSLLNRRVDMVHFYKLLLKNIDEYALDPKEDERSIQHKKILAYLYTATLSKISALNNKHKDIMVVDINRYLDLVITEFDQFNLNRKILVINEVMSDYRKEIEEQMKNARGNIKEKILPEFNSIFDSVEKEIHILVNETIKLVENTQYEKEALRKKQKKLESVMILKYLVYPLKMIGEFMNFSGGVVEEVMNMAAAGNGVARHLAITGADSNQGGSFYTNLSKLFDKSLMNILDIFTEKRLLFTNQLQDLILIFDKQLHDNKNSSLSRVRGELSATLESGRLDSEEPDALQRMKEELGRVLSRERDMLQDSKDSQEDLRVINQGQKLLGLDSISPELYRSFTCDETHVEFIGELIEKLKKKIKVLLQFEMSIYNTIIPKMKHLKQVVAEVSHSTETPLREADIQKWGVKSIVNDIKFEVRHLTKGLDLGEELTRCLEKIEETLEVLFDVYDRLEDLEDKSKLAAYIANIHSADNIRVSDEELRGALHTLELSLSSNLLLESYNKALGAVTQSVFPFAARYLDTYKLPTSLEGGLDNLTYIAKHKLTSLTTKLMKSTISVGEYDQFIHSDVEFSSRIRNSQPFYKWSHKANSATIARVLDGKEVELNADIRDGLLQDAIKFREIGLNFRLRNETLQMEFNEKLRNFEVVMIHHGQSHYKCGNSFYKINSIKQTFTYHMETDSQGKPINRNLVYDKVKKSEALLSPYTMWTFKLTHPQENFRSLNKYKNEIVDLELVGLGQYVERGKLDVEVCNDDLQNYYQIDGGMSVIDDESIEVLHMTEVRRRKRTTKQGNSSILDNISGGAMAGMNHLKRIPPLNRITQWMYGTKDEMPVSSYNYLLDETDCMTDRLTGVDSSVLESSGNLLLWNLVVRKLCDKDRKRTRRINPPLATGDSHSLAYRYYAARNHLPPPTKLLVLESKVPKPSDTSGGKSHYYLPPPTEQVYTDYSSLGKGTKADDITFPAKHLLE